MLRSHFENIHIVYPNTADQIVTLVAKSKYERFEVQITLWFVRDLQKFKKATHATFSKLFSYLGKDYILMCDNTLCVWVQELVLLKCLLFAVLKKQRLILCLPFMAGRTPDNILHCSHPTLDE